MRSLSRLSSLGGNPKFRASAKGWSQNFGESLSRSAWTCGGSFGSWLKKYTRYGPLRRTVGTKVVYHMHQVTPNVNAQVLRGATCGTRQEVETGCWMFPEQFVITLIITISYLHLVLRNSTLNLTNTRNLPMLQSYLAALGPRESARPT